MAPPDPRPLLAALGRRDSSARPPPSPRPEGWPAAARPPPPGPSLRRCRTVRRSPVRATSPATRTWRGATACAYLSAAGDFAVSRVVDRTVGMHGVIPGAHFRS
ncbi:hypothetical protein GCM10009772_42270 [Pseudonocardia alni subsp. carboxydivorans]